MRIKEAIKLYNENNEDKMTKKLLASKLDFGKVREKSKEIYLQQAINGDRDLNTKILKQICQILNVNSDYLLGLSEYALEVEYNARSLDNKIDELKKASKEMLDTVISLKR